MKLERDTETKKNTRIRVLEPFWSSGQIVLASDLLALEAFLDEASRFRLTKPSVHDDMLDALADCLQLRVRPNAPSPTQGSGYDPDILERLAAERAIQGQRTEQGMAPLDGGSLRVARIRYDEMARLEAERQEMMLGAGQDESFAVAGW